MEPNSREILTRDKIPSGRRQGFIGLYHPFKGRVYAGTGIDEDEDLYEAYLFGENAILSVPGYGDYLFRENIEAHCRQFDVNRVHGMAIPPSEKGVVNNPEDTSLWEPASPPGMIQAASRYSKISRIYPQVSGMIIDDFWANYGERITLDDLRNIRAALRGKAVNANGSVDHSSQEVTPELKLYVVTYEWELGSPDKDTLDLIDGTNLWIYRQEENYKKFDEYIDGLRRLYPGKEIIPGIYIHNSDHGDMSRESIYHLLQKSIDLYDDGLVSGTLVFAGHWLVKNYISRERSQIIDVPGILHQIYYPHLGSAMGVVVDGRTLRPIEGAVVSITCRSRRDGPVRIAARKRTDSSGAFRFSGWAGYGCAGASYGITVTKDGYETYLSGFRISPGEEAVLSPILCSPINCREEGVASLSDLLPDSKTPFDSITSADSTTPSDSTTLSAHKIFSNVPEEGGRVIGDLFFPRCIAIPLEGRHTWSHTEAQVIELLESLDQGQCQPDIWDSDDRAMRAVHALKDGIQGCPCGIALGEVPGTERISSVVVYWTSPTNWRFWDPGNRKHSPFNCRYVVA